MGCAETSKYIIKTADRRFFAGGPTEFTSITLEQEKAAVFVAFFNDFTISSSVIHAKNSKNSFIIAGIQTGSGAPAAFTPKDCTLTINAGDWNEVEGTSRGTIPSGVELKDYYITINVGDGVEVGKLAMFSTDSSQKVYAENSSCTVNLGGCKIRAWCAQSTTTATDKNGYENGVTVNVGADFDFEGSFQYEISNQDAGHMVNGVFYGIAGNNVRPSKDTNNDNNNKVVLDPAVYEQYKNWSRFNFVTVEKKQTAPTVTGKVVYLSDSGDDSSDGLTAQAPKRSLLAAFNALGNEGGNITVVGTYTQSALINVPAHTGKVTIRGYDENAHYKVGGVRFLMGGPLEFTDIKLTQTASNFMIVAFF